GGTHTPLGGRRAEAGCDTRCQRGYTGGGSGQLDVTTRRLWPVWARVWAPIGASGAENRYRGRGVLLRGRAVWRGRHSSTGEAMGKTRRNRMVTVLGAGGVLAAVLSATGPAALAQPASAQVPSLPKTCVAIEALVSDGASGSGIGAGEVL